MNDESLPPPPPELARLYRAEARFPEEPTARREQVRASLLLAIASGASAADPSAVTAAKLGVSSASLWFGAGGLVVGLVAGASIAWPLALSTSTREAAPSAPPEARTVEVPREELPTLAAERVSSPAPRASADVPQEAEPRVIEERAARPDALAAPEPADTPSPPESRGGRLRAERTVLDAARAAIDDRDPARALAALDRHDALEGPRSLDEEASALRIIALSLAGRAAEASSERERFLSRFEGSVFMPAVDRATSSAQ